MLFRWPLVWRSSYDWAHEGWESCSEFWNDVYRRTQDHRVALEIEIDRLKGEVVELRGREIARDAMVRQVEQTFFSDCRNAGLIACSAGGVRMADPGRPSINMSIPMGLKPCSRTSLPPKPNG